MRNLFTLFFSMLFIVSGVFAQNNYMGQKTTTDAQVLQKSKRTLKIDPKYAHRLKQTIDDRALTLSFPLDYDQEDRDFATSIGATMDEFIWPLNSGYTNNDTFTLSRAMVFCDTFPNGTAGNSDFYPVGATTITIDSLDIWVSHVNNSGGTDSVKIRILDATGISIVGNDIVGTTLWQTTLATDTSITQAGFVAPVTVLPNLTLAQGQTFIVKVDYIGPAIDTFYVFASERDDCFGTCISEPSVIPFNSFFYLNFITGTGTNLSGFNYLVADCDGDGAGGTPGACEWFGPQNFFFFPFVTADVALSANVIADTTQGCENDVANLTVNVAGAQAPITYAWSPTTGLSDPTSPTPQVLIGIADVVYTVTVTDGNNDMTTASVSINSRGLDVTLPPTSLSCGGTANISAAITGDQVGISYLWNDGTTAFTNTVSSAGMYSITVTNLAGCSDDASVNVTIPGVSQDIDLMLPGNVPAPNSWCAGDPLTMTNTSSSTSGWSFTWDYGDGNSTGGLNGFNTYATANDYTITLTGDSAGCSFSESFDITILAANDPACMVGINDIVFGNAIDITPNPASEIVNITIDGSHEDVVITLFNLQGSEIVTNAFEKTNNLVESIDVSDLPQGTYVLQVESKDGVATKKFVVTK
ncbi:MAG: T9SS type A sorting domain-containing protein [Chitinophagales bacterium]|nr:T9SS type A sorting domain-containing protein [Chitinophagales bacterium]